MRPRSRVPIALLQASLVGALSLQLLNLDWCQAKPPLKGQSDVPIQEQSVKKGRQVPIKTALKQIVDFDFEELQVQDAIEFFKDKFDIEMQIDALLLGDSSKADPTINGHARQEKLEAAIQRVLKPLKMDIVVRDEVLLVVSETVAVEDRKEAANQKWGHLSGVVRYNGEPPRPRELKVDKDRHILKVKLYDESVVVNSENRGLANVVIWLDPKDRPLPVHPSYDEAREKPVMLRLANLRFAPHIASVRTKQAFVIKEDDPVGHMVNVHARRNRRIGPPIIGAQEFECIFDLPEEQPIYCDCNIHPWESCYIVIKDHPYVAISDSDGKFRIENLPVGEWTFVAWHEIRGYINQVTRNGRPESWPKGRFTVKIGEGENDVGELRSSPAQFERPKR